MFPIPSYRLSPSRLLLAGLTLALASIGQPALAAGSGYAGSFSATQACAATLNQPKAGTRARNPDQVRLQPGVAYPVIDASAARTPGWYRVQLHHVQPSGRWVPAQCGKGILTATPVPSTPATPSTASASRCTTPGLADGNVFAVSWQAAFCESHKTKPECTTPSEWAAGNFTLHGLWPNLSSCGTHYGFCSAQAQAKAFCDYPEPAIAPPTMDQLKKVMPSAAAGSCLQRHEWFKHGTCQTEWDAEGYFATAIKLTEAFNQSGIGPFMSANRGFSIPTQDVFDVIDQGLGQGAHKRMKFICTPDGMLVDIYMNLPAHIPPQATLRELLQAGQEGFSSNCGNTLKVDVMTH